MGRPSLLPRSETDGIGPDENSMSDFLGISCVKFDRGTFHLLWLEADSIHNGIAHFSRLQTAVELGAQPTMRGR